MPAVTRDAADNPAPVEMSTHPDTLVRAKAELPIELWKKVLKELDTQDRLRTRQVCTAFRQYGDEEEFRAETAAGSKKIADGLAAFLKQQARHPNARLELELKPCSEAPLDRQRGSGSIAQSAPRRQGAFLAVLL
ncbi:hypothetical protein WJX84_007030 [Apatococcus fuscideae]|uniref:F-box domain-containing protein n=1 Tax=Apatococcus fuscideae TaxID=2026836 RepID=A0AAW1T435_9CHLO